jgi:hypothetical protein
VQNIETVGVEKHLCKVGSEDVSRCPQRNPKNSWHSMRMVEMTDYHLFGKLKESLRGTRFEDDDALITATKWWLKQAGPESYHAGIQALVRRWHKAVEWDGDYVM